MLPLDLYYTFRPLIPRSLQIRVRRYAARKLLPRVRDRWPILESAGAPPPNWQGWPEGKQFALVLTHDVETAKGHDRCRMVMDLEESLGFRSCFNFVPERYPVSSELRQEMVARGFEVGVHGLRHDGRLFSSRRIFDRRAPHINRYLDAWRAVGFRSPSMHQRPDWVRELNITYDASMFDTDPFEPHPEACGRIFPFVAAADHAHSGFVELPYTLPQDFTLFVLLGEDSPEIWQQKTDWIASKGGMVLLDAHPDYMAPGRSDSSEEYPISHYRSFLDFIVNTHKGRYWHVLPEAMADFWRSDMQSDTATGSQASAGDTGKTPIWIDLDNTPHVPFFKPIIRELHAQGYRVALTARDAFQVCELADREGLGCTRIGKHYGKNRIAKVLGLFYRALQLAPAILREKPRLAVSHGSRSQIILSNLLRIPSVLIEDYEYAKFPPLMTPTWRIVPEVIPNEALACGGTKILKYPGIKENVYVPDFTPDNSLLEELGLSHSHILATVRPPATEAHYHNPESEALFAAAMDLLTANDKVRVVLLPRNAKQSAWITRTWPAWFKDGSVVIPEHAVDGLNLLWHSDLVISGGGTMNREAAALGVPVYSIFRGRIGAVDRHLSACGQLVLLTKPEDVRSKIAVRQRNHEKGSDDRDGKTLEQIIKHITSLAKQT